MNPNSDRLIGSELQESLGESFFAKRILVLASTGSTNDFLWRMLTPQLREGVVVFAEEQTAGRGQPGHQWESAPYLGLWFSFLLRHRLPLAESARLTNWAARSIATVAEQFTGLTPRIKPPNDVYLAGKKIAGVLVENREVSKEGSVAVVGIGLNVNQQRDDFPVELQERAGSLAMAAGKIFRRQEVAVALLRELERTRETLDPARPQIPREAQG